MAESVSFIAPEQFTLLEVATQGPPGPPGSTGSRGLPGTAAFVSLDPGNLIIKGSDDGIYAPDLAADLIAYYILAKA